MSTISRINILRQSVRLPKIFGGQYSLHQALDEVELCLGIRTRHGCAKVYTAGAKPFPQSEYIGARLARLERHVEEPKARNFFHLGAEG